MAKYILAIDQGTTSSRALLYDENMQVVGQGAEPFKQHFPKPDWVEHDLEEIWISVSSAIKKAIASVYVEGFDASDIAGIGITNQRETFGLWERESGTPLGRAIVWQCRRSTKICESLKKSAKGRKLEALSGLVLDPYFSGTKLKWRLDESPSLRKRAKAGEIAFGTMDTFLMSRLSSGDIHATDVSNASRTMMMDLKSLRWSDFALKTLGIPRELLPEIADSDSIFGVTRGLGFLPDRIPIAGVLGDQQAALFGQACFKPGEAKITYGTGAFFLLNVGPRPKKSKSGLSTVAWRIGGKNTYALEGSSFIAGAAVQWLRDNLKMIESSAQVQELAESVSDSDGVFFIPALSGLGAPDWNPHAKGLIGGLTRRSERGHIARACLEGIAHSVADSFEGLLQDYGGKIKTLRVDGGASLNSLLLSVQADLLQTEVMRPRDIESTARGAASVAALSLGIVKNERELLSKNPIVKNQAPKMKRSEAIEARKLWRRRVKALTLGAY